MASAAFVTGNVSKWKEVQAILGTQVLSLYQVDIDLPELQGSVEEIARAKCREAARLVGGPVIVEDTALCFDSLGGLPGPYIKWFLAAVGLDGLVAMLAGFPSNTAKAVCTFAYSPAPDADPLLFQGVTTGRIVPARGPRVFGWDPVFQPDSDTNLTYAEMSAETKNTLSHRYKALDQLRRYFQPAAPPTQTQ